MSDKELDINFHRDTFEEIERKINEYFSDPKNVEDFRKYMEEESKKPVWNHLQCNIIWCKHNKPDDPDMGTITWCSKYKNGEEELCEKECGKREWYEPILGPLEEEDIDG